MGQGRSLRRNQRRRRGGQGMINNKKCLFKQMNRHFYVITVSESYKQFVYSPVQFAVNTVQF